ncbi:hypothetical protein J2752_002270 [Halarchaeum rubridurum]|uniref:Uncharacterized protein n=1 Tax=Halarchaeum rubridurum TaxID=489911 RepID=A0A8T4GU51_9EURY|nr:hypothetical protein [Halarchaeum rubridurum]MBP1955347.1 hypothetical protein [Halarchaeum rubridurum]
MGDDEERAELSKNSKSGGNDSKGSTSGTSHGGRRPSRRTSRTG